jgi:glucokinase
MPAAARQVAVGIDVGGTTYTVAIIDTDGNRIADTSSATPRLDDAAETLRAFAETARSLISDAGADRPAGIGIGVPGTVSPDERTALDCPNLTVLNDAPVPGLFEQEMGLSAWMQNDAYCATLAELRYGAAGQYQNVLMVTLGTGVGGGIAFDNKVVRGPRQILGEIGHLVLDPDGPPCSCGTTGCLEAFVGKQAIIDRAILRLPAHPDSALGEYARARPASVTPKLIAQLAADGDPMCAAILAEIGAYIGQALSNAIVLCDPDIILIGGGIAGSGSLLLDAIRRTVREKSIISGFDADNIILGELGYRAGAIGAAALVWEHLGTAPPGSK